MKTVISIILALPWLALGSVHLVNTYLTDSLKRERERKISAALIYSRGELYCAHTIYSLLRTGEVVVQYKNEYPVRLPARGVKIEFVEYCE